jgi:hypothetical protein
MAATSQIATEATLASAAPIISARCERRRLGSGSVEASRARGVLAHSDFSRFWTNRCSKPPTRRRSSQRTRRLSTTAEHDRRHLERPGQQQLTHAGNNAARVGE